MSGFDVYLQMFQATGEYKPIGFGTRASVAVRGGTKLVQRFVKCLLTKKGSNSLDPEQGTDFPDLINSNITDTGSLEATVLQALADAEAQVKEAYAGLPNEPQPSKFNLLALAFDRATGYLDVRVELTTADGATIGFAIPSAAILSGTEARVQAPVATFG